MLEGQVVDRISLIVSALSAFTAIGASINTSQREDVRGVAILLYCGTFYPPCYSQPPIRFSARLTKG